VKKKKFFFIFEFGLSCFDRREGGKRSFWYRKCKERAGWLGFLPTSIFKIGIVCVCVCYDSIELDRMNRQLIMYII
jgi:hypothetical protein